MQRRKKKVNWHRRHSTVFFALDLHKRVKESAAAADLPISTWIRHTVVAELDRLNKGKQAA